MPLPYTLPFVLGAVPDEALTITAVNVYDDRIEVVFDGEAQVVDTNVVHNLSGAAGMLTATSILPMRVHTLVIPLSVREVIAEVLGFADRIELRWDGRVGVEPVPVQPPESAHYALGGVDLSADAQQITIPLTLTLTNPTQVAGVAAYDAAPKAPVGGGAVTGGVGLVRAEADKIPAPPVGGAKVV